MRFASCRSVTCVPLLAMCSNANCDLAFSIIMSWIRQHFASCSFFIAGNDFDNRAQTKRPVIMTANRTAIVVRVFSFIFLCRTSSLMGFSSRRFEKYPSANGSHSYSPYRISVFFVIGSTFTKTSPPAPIIPLVGSLGSSLVGLNVIRQT